MYMKFILQINTLIDPVGEEFYIAFIPLIPYETDIDTIISKTIQVTTR